MSSGNNICCTCGKKKPQSKCPNLEKMKREEKKAEDEALLAECEECKDGETSDEPKEGCPQFKNPKMLLSKRVHRVRNFAEMMSDERCFIKFCKRLHIVIGTCLYTWVLILACLLENINWTDKIKEFFCSLRQNSTIESTLDGLRLVECKLICSMAAPYKPGALWHYFLVIVLLPIIATIQLISFKVAVCLKVKNLILGEREPEPDEEPRQISSTQCTCVVENYVPPPKRRYCSSHGNEDGGGGEARGSTRSSTRSSTRTSTRASTRASTSNAEPEGAGVEAAEEGGEEGLAEDPPAEE